VDKQADFEVRNEGSIYLLRPMTDAAKAWCDEHLPEDAPMFGNAYVVEHRFIRGVVEGILTDAYTRYTVNHDQTGRPS